MTSLVLDGEQVLLTEALQVAGSELMGGFSSSWPLTKVLDIGGEERRPVFSRSSANACGMLCMYAGDHIFSSLLHTKIL